MAGWETVRDEWHATNRIHVDKGGATAGKRVSEMTQTKTLRPAGGDFVAELTKAKDAAALVLSAAFAQGLIDSDAIVAGSAGRFAMLAPSEKEALSFEHVAELGRPHGDPAKQVATYRAAFKVGGVVVSETTQRALDAMAKGRPALVDTPERRAAAMTSFGLNV